MEAVKKAKERFAKYPLIYSKCYKEGTLYAKCVLLNEELKKDHCANEFKEFSICLQKSAKNMKTRI